jgi:hypothetical protein
MQEWERQAHRIKTVAKIPRGVCREGEEEKGGNRKVSCLKGTTLIVTPEQL